MKKICRSQWLGRVPYQQAWDYQNLLAGQIGEGHREDTLLLLEHPHTYTLGRWGKDENLLWSDRVLKEKGVDVLWVDRGGDITYHGPGQIVGYPIFRLAPIGWHTDRLPQADYVGYLRKLEQVLFLTLAQFQIKAIGVDGITGVWVKPEPDQAAKKIASIGIKVDAKGVSRHGFALNVDPDMDYWQGIIPCGLSQVLMTSMAECRSEPVDNSLILDVIEKSFEEVFNLKIVREEAKF